jgi:hypothetical protein
MPNPWQQVADQLLSRRFFPEYYGPSTQTLTRSASCSVPPTFYESFWQSPQQGAGFLRQRGSAFWDSGANTWGHSGSAATGGIAAAGAPAEVLTVDLIRALYGVDVRLISGCEYRTNCKHLLNFRGDRRNIE